MKRPSTEIRQGAELLAPGGFDSAVSPVIAAARRGDPHALHQLALWSVYGQPLPRDFGAAREFFELAGKAGHSAAAAAHAVFVALGAGGFPPDFARAVELLRFVATLDAGAAAQVRLLEGMAITSHGAPISVPKVEPLSRQPRIGVLRGLFSPAECAHLAAVARPLLTPSIVVDPSSGSTKQHSIRTSDGAVLGPIQQDLVVEALNRRLAAATGTRVEQGEPLNVLRYTRGQQYRLHHDCLPGERNQRVITAVVYLSDDYSGGATCFPGPGIEFRGRVGDAIVFANTHPDGAVDEASRHAGMPVQSGEKWVCTRWIRSAAFDPWGLRSSPNH